jgi:diguanylate cyclase (GGDEF)-like protein
MLREFIKERILYVKKPGIPEDEETRLRSLRSLNILDTPPEERFDRIVRMAQLMFDIPVAFISLIDSGRQWFKSSIGIDFDEMSRDLSICAHAILSDEILVIPDAEADHRFAGGPLVASDSNARFCASCPIKLADGSKVGTLCIIDHHPRTMGDNDLALLRELAAIVEREFAVMQLAVTDELTGIYNRRGFIMAAQHSLNLCMRQDLPATLALLDLSEFRSIRDRKGQAEGDRVLIDTSHHLKSECRPSDIFARLGAEEFAALFINAPQSATEVIMKRFRKLLSKSGPSKPKGFDPSFTYVIVEYDFKRHKSVEALLTEGASAMHGSIHQKAS